MTREQKDRRVRRSTRTQRKDYDRKSCTKCSGRVSGGHNTCFQCASVLKALNAQKSVIGGRVDE
jgi:hypothetical protein